MSIAVAPELRNQIESVLQAAHAVNESSEKTGEGWDAVAAQRGLQTVEVVSVLRSLWALVSTLDAAAPDMLDALRNLHREAARIAERFDVDGNGFSGTAPIWAFLMDANDVILKAEAKQRMAITPGSRRTWPLSD